MLLKHSKIRVGCVKYINALPINIPFQFGKIPNDIEFVYALPAELNQLLRQKKLDIALTSSVEYLDGRYQLLPGFGIASNKKILSVNFYTQFPVSSLTGMRIGLTSHSATSIALLKVLCTHLWKIKPHFEILNSQESFSNYAAFLLIGDEALKNLFIPNFQTIDLGSAWHALTGLPFVFAVFVFRNEFAPYKVEFFQKQLNEALKWSNENKDFIEAEAFKRCSVNPKLIKQYYSVLQYRLGTHEMRGLQTFKQLKTYVSTISP